MTPPPPPLPRPPGQTPLTTPGAPARESTPTTSLWRELADGSAGWGIRLLVTIALAAALCGLVPMSAYFLASMVRDWNRYSGNAVYPEDWLVFLLGVLASGAFVWATMWLWSRGHQRYAMVGPAIQTLAVAALVIAIGVFAAEGLPGDSEFVVFGVVFVGAAAVLLIWVQAYRRRGPRWRAVHNQQDGMTDVRCPSCGYRMVGLTESRCPECGTAYTLDELIAKQGFGPRSAAQTQQAPVAAPTLRSA